MSTSDKITASSDNEDPVFYSSDRVTRSSPISDDERDTFISSPENSAQSGSERTPSPDAASSDAASLDSGSQKSESPIDFSSGDEHATSLQRRSEGPSTKARRSRFRRGEQTGSDIAWARRQPEGTVDGYESNRSSEDYSPGSP
jgi:hypothetical protein